MSLTDFSSALSNSLSLGSIMILTALGLAITFGVMRVINMAHGDLLMLGAYTSFLVEDPHAFPIFMRNLAGILNRLCSTIGFDPQLKFETEFGLHLHFFWAIPITFLVSAAVGYLLEVGLIRFLYGRPLDTLLATWGVGMILQQMVNLCFGSNLQEMRVPELLRGHWGIGELAIPIYRVFIVGVTLLCLLAVYLLFFKTWFGLKTRAVVQNRPMASALGISTRRVDSLSFAFASGLAGVAGCILAHQYNAKYNMGADYIVEAFMVVILGGLGQLSGSIGAGALIGTADSVVEKLVGNTSLAKVIVLLALITFIQFRPQGLFAAKERSYE
jgi:urea transport system permease protein